MTLSIWKKKLCLQEPSKSVMDEKSVLWITGQRLSFTKHENKWQVNI